MHKLHALLVVCAGLLYLVAAGGCASDGGSWPTSPWPRLETYEFVLAWGDSGSGDGQLAWPAGLAVDDGGNVYVADQGNHRIQKFTGTGVYLAQWGTPGDGTGSSTSPKAWRWTAATTSTWRTASTTASRCSPAAAPG